MARAEVGRASFRSLAPEVFREGAENGPRGACAPRLNLRFRAYSLTGNTCTMHRFDDELNGISHTKAEVLD